MHSPQYNSLEYLIMLECNRIPQIAVNCILIVRMPHPKPVPDWPGSWWGRSARCRWACPPAVICRVQNSDAGQPPFVEKGKRAIIGQGLSTAVHGVRRLRCHWRVQKLMLCVYIYIYIYIHMFIHVHIIMHNTHTHTSMASNIRKVWTTRIRLAQRVVGYCSLHINPVLWLRIVDIWVNIWERHRS